MSEVTIGQRLECSRCRHAWNTRTERRPVQCPKCKSTSWEEPPRILAEAKAPCGTRERSMSDLVQMGDGRWMTLAEAWQLQKAIDWGAIPGIGSWGDPDKTPEEILAEIRQGWEMPEMIDDESIPD